MNTSDADELEPLLSIQSLQVSELRQFGFSYAGYVKAVDGVTPTAQREDDL